MTGAILPDHEIHKEVSVGDLEIEPFNPEQVESASYDVQLGNEFELVTGSNVGYGDNTVFNPNNEDHELETEKFVQDKFLMKQEDFVLATTKEYVNIPDYLGVTVYGRSSYGRVGIEIHRAGWGDPGFEGQITLEIDNSSPNDVVLEAGDRIGQLVFQELKSPASCPYDGSYQGQEGVTESKFDR